MRPAGDWDRATRFVAVWGNQPGMREALQQALDDTREAAIRECAELVKKPGGYPYSVAAFQDLVSGAILALLTPPSAPAEPKCSCGAPKESEEHNHVWAYDVALRPASAHDYEPEEARCKCGRTLSAHSDPTFTVRDDWHAFDEKEPGDPDEERIERESDENYARRGSEEPGHG